ncbi:MAG TPA: LptF/LptG family permease [Candidatus Methylacidiphilales bacterium]|nr:LptF/LptG family permease [Candidatus Methylacidiphilales bacterium]
MTLIYHYIFKEIIVLTAAIIGVLTFLLMAVTMFRVLPLFMYSDLPMWLAAKLMFLGVPLLLTLTIPAGLLAGVMIVFGRMSSDRELLALKAAGIGLAPIVAPVIIMAVFLSAVDYWLVAYVVPECQKESSGMKHEIVTNNPMALLSPEEVVDKIPGFKIYFSKWDGTTLDDVYLWQLDNGSRLTGSIRADHATIKLDMEHQQLVMTFLHEREENYPRDGDAMKVSPGGHGEQAPMAIPLNSFYEIVQRKLAWMTLPEIEDIIIAMQTAPTGEPASPYLTELQARISFSITTFTFIVVGIPLAIQTQRRETFFGIIVTFAIVLIYYVLGQIGHGLKAQAGLYPELIIWAPNILFQAVGAYLFYRANQK